MSRFAEALGPAIGGFLLPPLWGIVDDYRDLLWGCVVTSQYEDASILERCLRGLGQIADGLLINFSATSNLLEAKDSGGGDVSTDLKVIRKKVLELCIRSGFSGANIVLPSSSTATGGYDVRMNQLLEKFDSRAHYFIELQTTEALGKIDGGGLAKALYEIRDKKVPSPVSVTTSGCREFIFASDPLDSSCWTCLYPAHSAIISKRGTRQIMYLEENQLFLGHVRKQNEQLQLEADMLTKQSESKELSPFEVCRFRFYAAEHYSMLNQNSLAKCLYQTISDEKIGYTPNSWGSQQMAYVANLRLIALIASEAKDEDDDPSDKHRRMISCAIRAHACDPQRYEALLQLLIGSDELVRRHEITEKDGREALYYAAQQFRWVDPDDPIGARLEFVHPPRSNQNFTLFGDPDVTRFKLIWRFVQYSPSLQFMYAAANTLLKNILSDPSWIKNHRDLRWFTDAVVRAHDRCFPTRAGQLPPHVIQAVSILQQPPAS